MAAVRTEAQRQASRDNGRKGRGPVSEQGKLQSRRSGLRDGWFSQSVLPEELDAELPAQVAVFEARFGPRDAFEKELVRTAALAQVKLARLQRTELAADAERVRHAVRRWDLAREAEVEALADLLPTDPAHAVRSLQRIAEGCDRLGDLWQTLADALARSGRWDESSTELALNLCGLIASPTSHEWPELHALFEHAEDLATSEIPNPEALEAVQSFVAAEIERLTALGDELWEHFDRPDREAAPIRAMFDNSDDGRRLRRAIAETERLQRRALAELARARAESKAAAPAPEPPRRANPAPVPPSNPPARSEPEPRPLARPLTPPPTPRIDLDELLGAPLGSFVPIPIVPRARS